MAQLRRSNRRATFENCQGHEIPTIPVSRKPTEDFCPVHQRMMVKLADAKARVRHAGKIVVSRASEENIATLTTAKAGVKEMNSRIMEHLLSCETCK
ncbi:hypothetical protein SEA_BILLNYE_193 [Streptomyces phage BillNye]|uniref:Uncharacterized protein n=1 Tax=Streptomyces phage BillNye TaxID=2079426 RepID=A0A2L1IW43_9CAUD|nr:hypothetical protein FDJ30_gp068 [Streptomyces phage BillNye]AVD99365.1 hypothetical protein SEA_BILLNYE_193 [Streptomyces phage BillNye]